jgi:hypothetical protein
VNRNRHLVLDVLEQLLAPLPVLLLLPVGQQVVGDQVEVDGAATGVAQALDAALSLNSWSKKLVGTNL